jgi:hypothetical protein
MKRKEKVKERETLSWRKSNTTLVLLGFSGVCSSIYM